MTPTLAQPGTPPPPGLLIKVETSGRLLDGQAAELVYLDGAHVSSVAQYESSSDRTHITFTLELDGTRYPAVMYGGDWGEADEQRLASGVVDLIGLWSTYDGAPSLIVKWVESAEQTPQHAEPQAEDAAEKELVLIEGASISDVSKFVSSTLKMHVRFRLQAPSDARSFAGIAYEGDWNSDTLEALRSGTANLVGYWDAYQGEPSFVLQELE